LSQNTKCYKIPRFYDHVHHTLIHISTSGLTLTKVILCRINEKNNKIQNTNRLFKLCFYIIFVFCRWHDSTVDRLKASKTIWPIPQIEQVFLPDFKTKSQINEYSFQVPSKLSFIWIVTSVTILKFAYKVDVYWECGIFWFKKYTVHTIFHLCTFSIINCIFNVKKKRN